MRLHVLLCMISNFIPVTPTAKVRLDGFACQMDHVSAKVLGDICSDQNTVIVTLAAVDNFCLDIKTMTKYVRSFHFIDSRSEANKIQSRRNSVCIFVLGSPDNGNPLLKNISSYLSEWGILCTSMVVIEEIGSIYESSAHSLASSHSVRAMTLFMVDRGSVALIYSMDIDCVVRQIRPHVVFNSSRHLSTPPPERTHVFNLPSVGNASFRVTHTSPVGTMFSRYVDDNDGTNGKEIILEGVEVNIMEVLAEVLNFNFTYVDVVDPENGFFGYEMSNGRWSGVIGMVHRGEADIAIGDISITYPRSQVVDYTFPLIMETMSFLYVRPPQLPRLRVLIEAFQWQTWLVILIMFSICMVFLLALPAVVSDASFQRRFTRSVFFLFGSLVGQSVLLAPNRHFARLIVAAFWFYAVVMKISYETELTSRLSQSNYPPPIDTFKQLLDRGYTPYSYSGIGSVEFMKSFEDPNSIYRRVLSKMKFIDHDWNFKDGLFEEKAVYFHERSGLKDAVTFQTDPDRLVISKLRYFEVGLGMPIRKDSCYRDVFAKAILDMVQTGLPHYWINKNLVTPKSEAVPKPLGVFELSIAFVILIGGFALAFISFLIENCHRITSKK